MTKAEKAKALAKIAERISKAPCPLRKTATNPVPGEGNPSARVVFIGEAPGRNEDKTGRPFVGAAGKILDELLKTAGLKRADVFITSIEKFRPPNNREPLPAELKVCVPFLNEQLAVIKPKIVVALGRHAMNAIIEKYAPDFPEEERIIGNLHGKKIKAKEFTIVPMYHPAAAIYNRSLMASIKKDFRSLK